uniref:Uncharacterized protein n=1 Tax=Amphimedon queenslandica TaxID=400682 RepID=A0A1X7VDG1_AMPQE
MNEHNSFISKPLETTVTHVNVPALVLNIPSLIVNVSATSALPSQEKDAIGSFQIAEVSEVPSPKKSDDVQDDAKPCKKESEEKLALEINSSPQNSSFVIPIAKEHVETTNDSKEVQAQEKVHDSKEVHIDDSEDEDSKVPEYNKSNDHIICEPTLPDACEKLNMRSDSNEQMDASDSEDEDSKAPEYNKSNDHIICEPTLPDTCEKLNMRSDSFEQMDASGTTSHPYERINMSLLDAPSHPYETIKRDDSYEDMNVSSFQYERVDFST